MNKRNSIGMSIAAIICSFPVAISVALLLRMIGEGWEFLNVPAWAFASYAIINAVTFAINVYRKMQQLIVVQLIIFTLSVVMCMNVGVVSSTTNLEGFNGVNMQDVIRSLMYMLGIITIVFMPLFTYLNIEETCQN